MQSSAQAKRTTETLARIAQVNERRALVEVVTAERTLNEQANLRERLKDEHHQEEDEAMRGDSAVTAGFLQLINGSRQAHSRRLQELDNAMGETAIALSHRRNAHDIARQHQRTASTVADRVLTARRRAVQDAQQKVDDDLTSTRYARRLEPLGNN